MSYLAFEMVHRRFWLQCAVLDMSFKSPKHIGVGNSYYL
jgi:hypothetical protein